MKILDFSEYFNFNSQRDNDYEDSNLIIKISTFSELKKYLKFKGGYVLDFVGQFSPKSIIMFNFFVKQNIKIIVYDSVPVINPPELIKNRTNFFKKIIYMFRKNVFRRHLVGLINKILIYCLSNQDPYMALTSGDSWTNDPRFTRSKFKIDAHSLDYEKYFQTKEKKSKILKASSNYAVYIDENITGHQDNVGNLNHQLPETFFPKLKSLFQIIENSLGLKVLIASYPTGVQTFKKYLKNKAYKNLTPELIKNSKLVLVHASTSLSFAVLYKTNVILTSNEIKKSWYSDFIEAPARFFKSPLITIDEIKKKLILTLNKNKYKEYRYSYLKSKQSLKLPLEHFI